MTKTNPLTLKQTCLDGTCTHQNVLECMSSTIQSLRTELVLAYARERATQAAYDAALASRPRWDSRAEIGDPGVAACQADYLARVLTNAIRAELFELTGQWPL